MAGVTLKTLWGLARSEELHMSDDELHLLVQSNTGKGSLKELSKQEIRRMTGILVSMKASVNGTESPDSKSSLERQRKKIYQLAKELGWDKPVRVNGMCRRMFGINSVEWLDSSQCSKLTEALKKMLRREQERSRDEQNI